MHRLASVSIKNFRSCANVSVPLTAFTPIVGQNNCGKSNMISAIGWLLKPSVLSSDDFGNVGEPVEVTGVITGLTRDHLNLLADDHRERIESFCRDGSLTIRRTQASPGGGARNVVLEVKEPTIGDKVASSTWKRNPTGIDAAIQALFPEPIHIGAMEDAAADVTSGKKDSTIGRLVARIVASLEAAHGQQLAEALEGVRRRLTATGAERAPELSAVDDEANRSLADLFPGLRVSVHFEPPSVTDLFKSGTIKAFEGARQVERSVDSLGHGAQRAIQMALIRYLATAAKGQATTTCTLLLIDEPELYLHPYGVEQVRSALRQLSVSGFQVIFSTHSPLTIELEDIPATLMVYRPEGSATSVRKTVEEAWRDAITSAPSQSRKLFEFGNAAKLLFASKVIIAEGDTEQRLLPCIYRQLQGRSLMADGIALITLGGSGNIGKCLRLLKALAIPAGAIVDLDFAFRIGHPSGLLVDNEQDVAAIRHIVSEIKEVEGFLVNEDGFPRKGNGMSAAEAFVRVAAHPAARAHIGSIGDTLRQHNIWLWDKGAIEAHLGVTGKGEDSWSEYVDRLGAEPLDDVIADLPAVTQLLSWMSGEEALSMGSVGQGVAPQQGT